MVRITHMLLPEDCTTLPCKDYLVVIWNPTSTFVRLIRNLTQLHIILALKSNLVPEGPLFILFIYLFIYLLFQSRGSNLVPEPPLFILFILFIYCFNLGVPTLFLRVIYLFYLFIYCFNLGVPTLFLSLLHLVYLLFFSKTIKTGGGLEEVSL